MKKFITFALLFLPLIVLAQTCPPPKAVYIFNGTDYIPNAPSGWRMIEDHHSYITSNDVRFVLAAYGADLHTPTEKNNHVRCYYGNPDLTPRHGIAIGTEQVVPESTVASHAEWNKNEHYYLCNPYTNDVNACHFG